MCSKASHPCGFDPKRPGFRVGFCRPQTPVQRVKLRAACIYTYIEIAQLLLRGGQYPKNVGVSGQDCALLLGEGFFGNLPRKLDMPLSKYSTLRL